jgi:hypothetical protein
MTIQCKAVTEYPYEERCSRQAKVKIDGVGFCIPHAAKICLQQALKDGVVEPIDPEDWFYKKIINKIIKISA